MARHEFVLVPWSKMHLSIARLLRDEGLIESYEVLRGKKPLRLIKIYLKYYEDKRPAILGLKRASRPGCRVYVQKKEIPRVYGGLGIAIVSTSKGIMTGQQAWRRNLGGELLCYIW
jgi:small subunit ribosomal protein S8